MCRVLSPDYESCRGEFRLNCLFILNKYAFYNLFLFSKKVNYKNDYIFL